jgi:predicted RNase H-like nuclease (RuvC/YqgF family)
MPASSGPAASVTQLAQNLTALEQRLAALRRAVDNLIQLRQVQATLAGDQQVAEAATEIEELQRRADELEAELFSQVATWHQVKETFWQAVRFGGLGLVVGWLLKSWIG